MAEELRIISGDTYDVIASIVDRNGAVVNITSGGWNIAFESDIINKNSVDNPGDFIIEQSPYVIGQVVINLSSAETGAANNLNKCRKHFKIKLYKDTNPALVKTVASGDLFFIDEV